MGETLVRFEGAQEVILERLTDAGVFKTRSEAIRAGILELGKEYQVFEGIKDIEDELVARKMQKISKEVKQGKRKVLSEKQMKEKYGFK